MSYFKIIVVVLVYKNTDDLRCFFRNNTIPNSRVVVVNSFYNAATELEFSQIARDNFADFISVPNRGYGAGNNAGCKYALEHYEFDYLIISNADISIKKLNFSVLKKYTSAIIAPKILTLRKKNQNPSCPFTPNILQEKLQYLLYKGDHRHLIWFSYLFSRLRKIIFYIFWPIRKTIFSAHGAFVIFTKNVLQKLYPLYNEEMFLFKEEEHVGRLAKSYEIKTYYEPEIIIEHREDGSIKVSNISVFEQMKNSYLIYYNKWLKK